MDLDMDVDVDEDMTLHVDTRVVASVVAIVAALSLLAPLFPIPACAKDIFADITADTRWTAAESPYRISPAVTVAPGATLTIDPGARVELAAGASLIVRGQVIARGIEGNTILFTGIPNGTDKARWQSVVFDDSSTDAAYTGIDDYQSGSIVEWCVFENATKAIQVLSSSPYIHACDFRDNRTEFQTDTKGGAAIYLEGGSRSRIRDCKFTNNAGDGFASGGAIFVEQSDPIIQDNVFTSNSSVYGGAVATNLMASIIAGNRFEGNQALSLETSEGGESA